MRGLYEYGANKSNSYHVYKGPGNVWMEKNLHWVAFRLHGTRGTVQVSDGKVCT